MKKCFSSVKVILLFTFFILSFVSMQLFAQVDPWILKADKIDPSNYFGITVANGMIGIVSSPEPFKEKNVVLAGTYDLYGRGRVSNFLKSFNLLNMRMDINGKAIDALSVKNFNQELDMHRAAFTSSFDYLDQAEISYTYYSLRQLPFCVMMEVKVKAIKNLNINAANEMEAPDALRDVQNYYNEIDHPHVTIGLLTSSAKSPTEKLQLCASTTFLFTEVHGKEPRVIHEMWDSNMHLMKFNKAIKAGETYSFCVVGTPLPRLITTTHSMKRNG